MTIRFTLESSMLIQRDSNAETLNFVDQLSSYQSLKTYINMYEVFHMVNSLSKLRKCFKPISKGRSLIF